MDLSITELGTDLIFVNDLKINAKHILDSEVGEFKNYPLLYLGKSVFVNHKQTSLYINNKIKEALDYDNIIEQDVIVSENE